uniref:Uncharacterized protein n=1 Tax=Ananas comosus var. bracteatus TaxID=296719 RepID=A0A6V7NF63_ANACO|nr:unnamed protein product [Ananas comosus var. bracteatus]
MSRPETYTDLVRVGRVEQTPNGQSFPSPSTFHPLNQPSLGIFAVRDRSQLGRPVPEGCHFEQRVFAFGNRSLPERPVPGRPVLVRQTDSRELHFRDLAKFRLFLAGQRSGTGPSLPGTGCTEDPAAQPDGTVPPCQGPVPRAFLLQCRFCTSALADPSLMHFMHFNYLRAFRSLHNRQPVDSHRSLDPRVSRILFLTRYLSNLRLWRDLAWQKLEELGSSLEQGVLGERKPRVRF